MKWIILLLLAQIVAPLLISRQLSSDDRQVNYINSNANQTSNACDNFYMHACGNYAKRHINDNFSGLSSMLEIWYYRDLDQIMDKLHLRSQTVGLNESSVEAKALSYYTNCLKAAPQTWMDHMRNLPPPGEKLSWPVSTPLGTHWPKDQFKWMDTLAILHRYGITNSLVKLEGNSSLVVLSAPSFEDDLMISAELSKTFYNSILFSKLQLLESQIRNLIKTETDPREPYLYKSLSSIRYITDLDFQKFIESLVGHRISPDFPLLVNNFYYFAALKRKMDSTDPEILAYYLMIRFIHHLKKNTVNAGMPVGCLLDLNQQMELATNLFYKEHFQDSATLEKNIQEVHQIFDQLRRQLVLQVQRNRLGLTTDQKNAIIAKVQAIALNIGNIPKNLDHRSFVSRYYEDLQFPTKDLNYGRVQLELLKFSTRKQWDHVLDPASKPNIHLNYQGPFSATYSRVKNLIVLPLSHLQEPFFSADSHDVFKYSMMGMVLGHEIMHSLDTSNILINGHGLYQDIGIWSVPQFRAGINCMVSQKAKFLEERMADTEGAKLAYAAYSSRNSKELDKLFFVSMGQLFCEGSLKFKVIAHDELLVRLGYIVNNQDAFITAFGCSPESNQHGKCDLW